MSANEHLWDKIIAGKFVLIAEIGVNYYDIAAKEGISNMDAAKKMIHAAKEAGIDAVKFQTYKADTIAAKNSPSYWDTTEESVTSQYELFKKYDSFGYDEYLELSKYSKDLDISFLSTAFDTDSADYLYDMMDAYKISSSDINNLPFIAYQAKKQKPMLISTGAANLAEIDQAISTIRNYNQKPLVLMHCVLEYPTPYEHANLNKIISLKNRYPEITIGYSDHTKPDTSLDVIKTAYNLGASVIEKHFTLDKTLKGNDHYHAMDFNDAQKLVKEIHFIDSLRGSYDLKCLDSEQTSRLNARRSLVSLINIKKGTALTEDMITYKRPGTGISPAELHTVLGKKAKIDITEDTTLQYDFFE